MSIRHSIHLILTAGLALCGWPYLDTATAQSIRVDALESKPESIVNFLRLADGEFAVDVDFAPYLTEHRGIFGFVSPDETRTFAAAAKQVLVRTLPSDVRDRIRFYFVEPNRNEMSFYLVRCQSGRLFSSIRVRGDMGSVDPQPEVQLHPLFEEILRNGETPVLVEHFHNHPELAGGAFSEGDFLALRNIKRGLASKYGYQGPVQMRIIPGRYVIPGVPETRSYYDFDPTPDNIEKAKRLYSQETGYSGPLEVKTYRIGIIVAAVNYVPISASTVPDPSGLKVYTIHLANR